MGIVASYGRFARGLTRTGRNDGFNGHRGWALLALIALPFLAVATGALVLVILG